MEKPRPCGCKGIRTCLICEEEYGLQRNDFKRGDNSYVYCPFCNKAWPGWDWQVYETHPDHIGDPIQFQGIFIKLDFISSLEEDNLMKGIDEIPWDLSQSGRRKQNFGPKCNFKKKRIRLGNFDGFPFFTKFIQDRFHQVDILKNYQTIEQCTLEYDPARGASIDPHIDDCWIWGERIVTVNLLEDSVLTFTPYCGDKNRYNLPEVSTYKPVLDRLGNVICHDSDIIQELNSADYVISDDVIVRVPMPRRSLLVMFGDARYKWEHCVLREDIPHRRVCLAYREFTPPYLNGDKCTEDVLKKAAHFWDHKQDVI